MKQESKSIWIEYVNDIRDCDLVSYIIRLKEREDIIEKVNKWINKSEQYIDERNFFKWLIEYCENKIKEN